MKILGTHYLQYFWTRVNNIYKSKRQSKVLLEAIGWKVSRGMLLHLNFFNTTQEN